jgi:hypothetical protein
MIEIMLILPFALIGLLLSISGYRKYLAFREDPSSGSHQMLGSIISLAFGGFFTGISISILIYGVL